MAKLTKLSLSDFFTKPKNKYQRDYNYWNNKSEWEIVNGVKNRLQNFYNIRQNSCYLTNFSGTRSWDEHWDLLEKDYLRSLSDSTSRDDYQSDVKSSISFRTIQAMDAKERRQEVDFMIEPRNEEDETKGKGIAFTYIFKDYLRRNREVRYNYLESSRSAKIFGTAFAYIPYSVRMRMVLEQTVGDISKEDLANGIMPTVTEKETAKVDFEDVDFIPLNIRDVYVDPNADRLHGTANAAVDAGFILYPTVAQVKMMFQGDPFVQNLDKIGTGRGSDQVISQSILKPIKNYEEGYCELIFYYNKQTDSEIIICDNVLLKDGPIPYQDKQIPLIHLYILKHSGHIYGMGVGDMVMQQAAEESALKNMRLDRLKLITQPPIFMGATVFGEGADQLERVEPNMIVKLLDITQVKSMDFPNIPFDNYRATEELRDEAVMNTGINPQGMSLPMSSTPATNTLSMKETIADMSNMYADNQADGIGQWGKFLFSRFCQFYSKPTRKAALELDKVQLRELRLEDIELYEEDGSFKARKIKGSKLIPMDKKMFDWSESPNIYISPDYIVPISSAFKAAQAERVLPQLIVLAGDPNTKLQNGSDAPINLRKLVSWYLDQLSINKNMMNDDDEDRIDEMKQAQEQQQKMRDGEDVPGTPGEPRAHRYTHAVELMLIEDIIQKDEFGAMLQSGDPQLMAFAQSMLDYKDKLAGHSRVDNLLEETASEAAVQRSDAIDQTIAQQQMGIPMSGMFVPQSMGGNQMPTQNGQMPSPNNMGQEDVMGGMMMNPNEQPPMM